MVLCVTLVQTTAAPSHASTESVLSSRMGTAVHVRLAGRERTVNGERTSVSRTPARMVEPVMTV